MQPMQRENDNTLFDMCSEDLKDPTTKKAYRKMSKFVHSYCILDYLLRNHRQCNHRHAHQVIEGTTRYQDATGRWRSINRSTFAGWYTRSFCEDILSSFEQEFAIRDATGGDTPPRTKITQGRCVRFKFPHRTLPTFRTGPYLPTKILQCPHCPSSFSSLPAQRQHMLSHHPREHEKYQLQRQAQGDKRIKLRRPRAASGPIKVYGERTKGNDDGTGTEPKPAAKPTATVLKHKTGEEEEEQLHHAEAPVGKRQRVNLKAGDRLPLPADDLLEINTMMEQLWLPKTENRTIITGYHISLGTYMQEGILRPSPHNDKYAEIIKKVNQMIGGLLRVGSDGMLWRSTRTPS